MHIRNLTFLINLTSICLIDLVLDEASGETVVDLKSGSDEPLILTGYLEQGRISEAREAASVRALAGNVSSYAGYFTVDKKYDSNLYFWYFPSETNPETAPVVVWLQGGPGGSSMYGLFSEIGPYAIVNGGNQVEKRDIYWSKTMHLIFIDNPVGTGFSFTNSSKGYLKDQTSVGNSLYSGMQQFFTLFPELRKLKFYVTGESYAGKYVPALSYTIHIKNPTAEKKINLKGLAVVNAVSDPINQIDYGPFLFQVGLIDENQKIVIDKAVAGVKRDIRDRKWLKAYNSYMKVINESEGFDSLYYQFTGFANQYSYIDPVPLNFNEGEAYLNMLPVQNKIHVGQRIFSFISSKVNESLTEDYMKSVAPWISLLANNYKVMMLNGQLDVICGYPMAANYLGKLKWCGAKEFTSASRKIWRVNGEIAGYIKTSAPGKCKGSLSLVLVRNASHTVARDQPLWTYQLISDFIK